jgi:putative membrane protein
MFLAHSAPFWFPGMLFFVVSKVLWLILLVLLILALIRWLTGRTRYWGACTPDFPFNQQPPPPAHQLSAMEILRQRFARGEIDAVTYDQMRERLEASERPSHDN